MYPPKLGYLGKAVHSLEAVVAFLPLKLVGALGLEEHQGYIYWGPIIYKTFFLGGSTV